MPRKPNTRPTSIYWLIDTRTGVPFYCGKTVQKIEYRLNAHKWDTVRQPTRPVYARLIECGDNVKIVTVELVPVGSDWVTREIYWITELRRVNPDCVNVSNGGDGAPGHIPSQATRSLMREKMLGRTFSDSTRAKMSARMKGTSIRKGKKLSPEASARISIQRTGKKRGPHSQSHRAAISAAQKGRPMSDENRQKLREAWVRRRARELAAIGVDKSQLSD